MSEAAWGREVRISWEQARAANLANWESRVPLHLEGYQLEDFRRDPHHLSQVIRTDLPVLERFLPQGAASLAGLRLCHLQCHIGTDTLSLARAGAQVTGVDFSAAALVAAAALARDLGLEATWVETDVMNARAAVQGDFDVVYTSIGTITWLQDLSRWAQQISGLLRAGGTFFIRDSHPALLGLDENAEGLVTRHRYFADGRARAWDETTTYLGDGEVASPRTYDFPHPISEIVNALIGAGLSIEFMDEGSALPWKFSESMEGLPDGDFAYPEPLRARIPTTFTLVARKPA
jgi:2-polyprenyl-3-methyl-5-hydroxy-6-metoxy-1,4-benzoquinol methylase